MISEGFDVLTTNTSPLDPVVMLHFLITSRSENGYGFQRPGQKTDKENDSFGLKEGQDLENRAAHPHQEFLGVPPIPFGIKLCNSFSFLGSTCLRSLGIHSACLGELL